MPDDLKSETQARVPDAKGIAAGLNWKGEIDTQHEQ